MNPESQRLDAPPLQGGASHDDTAVSFIELAHLQTISPKRHQSHHEKFQGVLVRGEQQNACPFP
jgi:hypothetical protein